MSSFVFSSYKFPSFEESARSTNFLLDVKEDLLASFLIFRTKLFVKSYFWRKSLKRLKSRAFVDSEPQTVLNRIWKMHEHYFFSIKMSKKIWKFEILIFRANEWSNTWKRRRRLVLIRLKHFCLKYGIRFAIIFKHIWLKLT